VIPTPAIIGADAAWRFSDVGLACRGRLPRAARPRLLARLRGRLGQHLHGRIAAADHAVLFPAHGRVPPPFVLRIDGPATAPVLVVRLFGRAGSFGGAFAEALEAAAGDGLIVPGGPAPLTSDARAAIVPGSRIPVRRAPETVNLRFLTPLCLDFSAGFALPSLLGGMVRRLGRLAAWQNRAEVPALPDISDVMARATLRPHTWMRIAHRQGGRRVPMEGYDGEVCLQGRLSGVMPLLDLAELCHAGRHAAFGMGRFDMVISGEQQCI
jgi:hypothetical protein